MPKALDVTVGSLVFDNFGDGPETIVFENLVRYIERDEIRPVVSGVFPLSRIAEVQEMFLAKGFVGKLVLEPPSS